MKLINKAAVIAEMEKAIDSPAPSHDQQCDWEDGYWGGLYKAECIIGTLEVKDHFPKDSDELDVLINYVLDKKQKLA